MKKTLLAVALAQVCLPSMVYADTSTDEVMVVTANQFKQPVKNVIAPVSIVTKSDIELMQAKSINEVLRTLPGVQVSSNGGYGQLSNIYVRGSNNVLFLINGIRIGSATSGGVNLGQLPLTGIERIEFVRGSRAAVYGADATAGVINIITLAPSKEVTGSANVGAGSDGYQQYQGSIAGQMGEKSWGKVAANYERADGFDAASFGNPDRDGFDSKDIVAEVGYQFNDNWRGHLSGFYHDGSVEYDYDPAFGPGSDEADYELYNVATQLSYEDTRRVSTFIVATNRDESENYGTVQGSTIVTDRTVLNWRHNETLTETLNLGFGAEYNKESVKDSEIVSGGSVSQYEQTSRDNKAAYITAIHDDGQFQVEGSLRYDDNEVYGDKTTVQAGAGWFVTDTWRLTANYGTGFRVPTFNQLFWPGFSDPSLKPEETEDYEVALEGYFPWADLRLSAFRSDITNRISCQDNSTCSNDNVRIDGIEFTAGFDTGWVSHTVSLDLLDPEDKDSGKQVDRVAKENFKWNMAYLADAWQASLNYQYQGKRYDRDVTLDGYHLVDIAGSYNITEQFNIGARIANLFDTDYQLANGYNTQERSYYVNLGYRF